MRYIVILLFVYLFGGHSFAQNKKMWLQYGDDAFKQGDYASAAYFYSKIIDKNSSESKDIVYPYDPMTFTPPVKLEKVKGSDSTSKQRDTVKAVKTSPDENSGGGFKMQYVSYRLAESYRLGYFYERAETGYEYLLQNGSVSQYPDARYWYAASLMKNAKYELALKQFEKCQEESPDKQSDLYKRAARGILNCHFSLNPKNENKRTAVYELDTIINFGMASFAPNFFGENNILVFASTKKELPSAEPGLVNTFDLYVAEKSSTDAWSSPTVMSSPLNTFQQEGAGVLSPDKKQFFFTRWTTLKTGKKECAIYVSRNLNGQWMQPMKLNAEVNADGFHTMHPAFNMDGTVLFFSSDRPGGFGKMDIWATPMDEMGNAGKPFNLGPAVNTFEDEVSPYFEYRTQTLYFSSDGHIGFGGLDIFKSYRQSEDTLWSMPLNLGSPVNSSRDDSYFVISSDQTARYFASDRKSCAECLGGNCMRIYYGKGEPILITLKGKVVHKETKQPLANTLIEINDTDDKLLPQYIITNDQGEYNMILHEDMNYFITVRKNRFFGDKASIVTTTINKSEDIVRDFELEPIPGGEIVLKGIEYDYDKATLRPESQKILDILYDMLALNDNLIVELSSHTDARGSDEYNMKLSHERAKSCVDYLVGKGIPKDRLVHQGYGETKPLVTEEEINKMKSNKDKEEAHQRNRRTAISILKEEEIRAK